MVPRLTMKTAREVGSIRSEMEGEDWRLDASSLLTIKSHFDTVNT